MKIQTKMYNPNMDLELDQDPELTPKNWLQFSTHMVIQILDGSSCKMYNYTSDTYILHTHEKDKKTEFATGKGIDQ